MKSNNLAHRIVFGIALASCCLGTRARAETTHTGDPFAYNLRFAVSPLAFQAAMSQSWFGSALRAEYSPFHFMDVAFDGRMAWFNANQTHGLSHSYMGRIGFAFHLAQSVSQQPLYGTVYPADTPALSAPGVGTDHDLYGVSSSERLRTGMPTPYDRDVTLAAAMRSTHSLRVGAAYTTVLEHARPDPELHAQNQLPMLHVGYSFTTQWNLPESVTGKPELGYRRFYGDILLTTAGLSEAKPERTPAGQRVQFQPVGARLGMQGAMEGLTRALPSLGFAYDLEIGVYPGRGGLEGFMFLALGVAFDVDATPD